jgi:hypothetical protein
VEKGSFLWWDPKSGWLGAVSEVVDPSIKSLGVGRSEEPGQIRMIEIQSPSFFFGKTSFGYEIILCGAVRFNATMKFYLCFERDMPMFMNDLLPPRQFFFDLMVMGSSTLLFTE